MRQFQLIHPLLLMLAFVAVLPPVTGCGTKKKPALTIEQRLAKAEQEKTPDRQAAAIMKVARSQFAANSLEEAKKTAGKALEKLKVEGDANLFAPRLVDIAGFLAATGGHKSAREALDLACGMIDSIDDPVRKVKLFAEAGATYKANTDAEEAKKTLLKAKAVADTVEERFRADALAAVAIAYTKSDLAGAANDVVEKLLKAAKALTEPRPKAEALAAAASVLAQTDRRKEAAQLLEDAEAAAKSIDRAENKAYALLAVANAKSAGGQAKDIKQALALLKEADKAADKVSEAGSQKKIVALVRSAISELEKRQAK